MQPLRQVKRPVVRQHQPRHVRSDEAELFVAVVELVALAGDEVLEAARIVLDALKLDAEYIPGDIGWEFWCKEGDALPKRTIDLLHTVDAAMFGAITSKPAKAAEAELAPSLRGKTRGALESDSDPTRPPKIEEDSTQILPDHMQQHRAGAVDLTRTPCSRSAHRHPSPAF
jgi:hypothetical protein